MGIYIKLNRHILIHLDIELLDAVFTKNTEHATLGILTRDLNNIVLRHPGIARTIRNTTLSR